MIAGFQGESGAFSELAVRALLGEVEARGYRTFEQVVAALESAQVDCAVLPHENTLHGPIPAVRDLVAGRSALRIAGEVGIPIEQCLIAMPDANVESIERVASHPVALTQCRRFLQQHAQWAVAVSDDTAGAVREMMEQRRLRSAAIGPAMAAERYGARVLLRGIQDDALNVTKFWLVTRNAGA